MSASTFVFMGSATECEFSAFPEFQFCIYCCSRNFFFFFVFFFFFFFFFFFLILSKLSYVISLVAQRMPLERDFLVHH